MSVLGKILIDVMQNINPVLKYRLRQRSFAYDVTQNI